MKTYPNCVYSGIDWIGDIPKDWKILCLKRVSSIVNGSTPDSSNADFWDGDINWVTPFDLGLQNGNKWIDDSSRKITSLGLNNCGASLTPKGSIILSTRAPIGHMAISIFETCTNQGCKTIVINQKEVDKDYLYFYLLANKEMLQSLGQGSTFIELSSQNLKDFVVICPNLLEQKAIADYLDRKTAQIDTLIAKKQRQVELLQEQRTAIITQAVTKGLNPSVPMKDSSVDWLGDIPEKWEVKRLKDIAFVNREALTAMTDGELEIHYIDISSVDSTGIINEPEIVKFKDAPLRARRIIKNGDIIISTVRTYLKSIAFIQSDEENLIASTGFATLSAKFGISPDFLFSLVSSHPFVEMVTANSVGVGYPAISSSALSNIPVWVPPTLEEQNQISEYIRTKTK